MREWEPCGIPHPPGFHFHSLPLNQAFGNKNRGKCALSCEPLNQRVEDGEDSEEYEVAEDEAGES